MVSLQTIPNDETNVQSLIDSLRSLLPDEASKGSYDRVKLKNIAERLSVALETPGDTAQRIAYYHLRVSVIRTCNNLNIFSILAQSPTPVSGSDLAKRVGADHALLQRLLRYLVSWYVIGEAGLDLYYATNVARNVGLPGPKAGIDHTFDALGLPIMALPSFLEKTKYQNPNDPNHCAFQEGFKTDENIFAWLPKHPQQLEDFNLWQEAHKEGRIYWLDFFPFDKEIAARFVENDKSGDAFFVDVGGAHGHEIEIIQSRYPKLPGKFVLQDLAHTIPQALPIPGLIAMTHDFFTEQPVKGAGCYYLRHILHDFPDDKCVEILEQLAKAMKPGYSKVLIIEMAVPDLGADIVPAQLDILMMTALAACERTASHWKSVVEKAGLKLEKIWTGNPDSESVIEVVL